MARLISSYALIHCGPISIHFNIRATVYSTNTYNWSLAWKCYAAYCSSIYTSCLIYVNEYDKINETFQFQWTLYEQYRNADLTLIIASFIHWSGVPHIGLNKLTIIGSDNGLSSGGRQAIILTNAGILLIGTLRTIFIEIWSEIHEFSFKKMHLEMWSVKWLQFCPGLNVLTK